MIDADMLLILTSNDYVTVEDENGTVSELKNLTASEANDLVESGKLNPLTTLPKVAPH